jgi:NADH:ubiquinone oxidoreductase subunit H
VDRFIPEVPWLQRFAWKVPTPLALFNIMVTAILKVVF